jgi:hypothetical protein
MLYDWSMDSNRSTEITRSKNTVVRARAGGVSTTPKFLAANFAKQNTDFGGGEREGGAGIPFPLAPFPARPARALGGGWVCRACGAALGRIFVKISSNFVQKVPPIFTLWILAEILSEIRTFFKENRRTLMVCILLHLLSS